MHNLGSLRRVCSQGYTSSLLYKKEIQWVYDISKSTMEDGDIHAHILKTEIPLKKFTSEDKPLLIRKIIEAEARTIQLYQSLLEQANLGYDAVTILSDHLAKLSDIQLKLKKDLKSDFIPQQSNAYSLQV